jgi:hypothetical protein
MLGDCTTTSWDQTSRVVSDQSVSYRAAAKEAVHSAGVKVATTRQMVFRRSWRVRSVALRSIAVSFAKARSIGLKSGLSGGS